MIRISKSIFLTFYRIKFKIRRILAPKKMKYSREFNFAFHEIPYDRRALINLVLRRYSQTPNYLEIGCNDDSTFNSIFTSNKVGVDPIKGGTHRMSSDDFFLNNKQKFDVIFIDGFHTYHQVKKDTINACKFANKTSTIISHDFLPQSWFTAVPNDYKVLDFKWNGDCWKFAFELLHKGINFYIVKIDEGIMVIDSPDSIEKIQEMESTIDSYYFELQFSYLYNNIDKLPLIEFKDYAKKLISKACCDDLKQQ